MSDKTENKDTLDFGYLQNIALDVHQRNNFVSQYLPQLLHSGLCKILKGVKSKGVPAFEVLRMLLVFPLLGVGTINEVYHSSHKGLLEVQKDVFYRLKNNGLIDWRSILFSVSMRFLRLAVKQKTALPSCHSKNDGGGERVKVTSSRLPGCLIFDDTDIEKTGYKIEGVSKIWSHVCHRYILGFKCLSLGLFDGVSFIGLDFSLHREQVEKRQQYGLTHQQRKAQYVKQRLAHQPSYERKEELNTKKSKSVLQMLKRSLRGLSRLNRALKQKGVQVEYVLCDSWFFSEALLEFCNKKDLFLLCGVKIGKILFEYKGKNYSPMALVKLGERGAKFSKKINAHYIPLIVSYKGVEVKLFFVKYRGQKKWRLILSANTALSFTRAMEIYQIRWSIEVFFKELKQYLGLNKCQSNHFEAHIAHISMAMILHQALTLKKRVENHATIGQLFRNVKSETLETTIANKLWVLFLKLMSKLSDLFEFDPSTLFKKLVSKDVKRFYDIFALE